jgi:glycosyltransferase involved in cell wall biosynthesis
MGLLEVPRGVAEMLDAIAILRGGGVPVVATIVGGGRDASVFHAQAAALGLGPEVVEFRGYIASHAEALRVVAAADIGVLPHRKSEAWDTTIPNKLFDYMAAGLPVITSDAAPFARIARETGAGVVFESRNPGSLASAIADLAAPARRCALAAAGRAAVAARYHWEHDEATLLQVLDDVAR